MDSFFKKNTFLVPLFTVLFSLIFILPFYFFIIQTSPFILSEHVTAVRDPMSTEITLQSETVIGQSFMARDNNLSKIALLIHRGQNPLDTYWFYLSEGSSATNIIRKGIFQVGKIRDTAFFQFEPIPDSQGKSYYFSIDFAEDTLTPLGFLTASNNIENASLYVNQTIQPHDLIFQTYYRNPISFSDFIRILFSRMSQYKPLFFKTPYIIVYWILFLFSLIFTIYQLLISYVFTVKDWNLIRIRILFLTFFAIFVVSLFLWIQQQRPIFLLENPPL